MVLIQPVPEKAVEHYRRMLGVKVATVAELRSLWRQVDPDYISESWSEIVIANRDAVSGRQFQAAFLGASYTAETLTESGGYQFPEGFVDPTSFVGLDGSGRPVESYLYSPAIVTKKAIGGGMSVNAALDRGRNRLDLLTSALISDTGRAAAAVDTAVRLRVGYVRLVNTPTCKDCLILAGKYFRFNAGFERHPGCDCVHVPAHESTAKREGYTVDPYEYFDSLTVEEQDDLLGVAGADIVREGGDIFQVVNATRHPYKLQGQFTEEGTSRFGYAGSRLKRGQRRLTPEGILKQSEQFWLSREETVGLMKAHGYILPGGQNPHGANRGQRIGDKVRPTAAQKRYNDAIRNWEEIQRGVNPYDPDAWARREAEQGLRDPKRQWWVNTKPSDEDKAHAEAEYYAALVTGGEKIKGNQSWTRAYKRAKKSIREVGYAV